MLIDEILKSKPDYVNEQGVEWWLDRDLMHYVKLCKLDPKQVQVFLTRHPDQKITRLIIENGEIAYEDTSLEGIGARLGIMKVLKQRGDAGDEV